MSKQLAVNDLELPLKSAEAIWNAYLIADQGKGALQVLLFHLQDQEFSSPAIASNRMRSLASFGDGGRGTRRTKGQGELNVLTDVF